MDPRLKHGPFYKYKHHNYVATYVHSLPLQKVSIKSLFYFLHGTFYYLKLYHTFYVLVYYLYLSLEYNLHDNRNLVCLVHCYIPST